MRRVGAGSQVMRRVRAVVAAASFLTVGTVLLPTAVGAQLTGVSFTHVVAGTKTACALSTSATLYCWGDDQFNQLLDNTKTTSLSPVALTSLNGTLGSATITGFATGYQTTCVLSSNSNVYCWGYGGQGQIGNGVTANALTPQQVIFSGSPTGTLTELVGGGSKSFCVLTSTSQIWCWGGNSYGQLGNGVNQGFSNVATRVVATGVLSGKNVSHISGTTNTFCALASGAAYCWGQGTEGALGNGTYSDSHVPVTVNTSALPVGVSIKQIAPSDTHSCFVDTSSNVWCWGKNFGGVDGLGGADGAIDSSTWFNTPQKVTTLVGKSVSSVTSSGTESCALTASGVLWCWGADPLGDGFDSGSVSTPETIAMGDIYHRTLTNVAVSTYDTCAVDSEGSLYCWGQNTVGEIGDGSLVSSVSPELIAVSPSASTVVTVPNSPRMVTGSPGNGSIVVTWSAPYSTGGAAITGYTATATHNASTFTCTGGAASTGCTITGLTNGTAYSLGVVATNVHGDSQPGGVRAITLDTVPDAPVGVDISVTPTTITVSWTPGASDGGLGISQYTATATMGGSHTCSVGPPATTCTITGVTQGTTYSVTVVATNSDGDSAPSTPVSATPGTVPSVPQNVAGVIGNASVAVSWTAPASNGGTPLTGYTASASQSGTVMQTCTAGPSATGCTITSLTNGSAYLISLVATNQAGDSSSVSIGSMTPITTADPPVLQSAVPGNQQITVTWAAGASNGGSAVTSYTATAKVGVTTASCSTGSTVFSCVIGGLANGTAYTVNVVALNGAGTSAPSSSQIVTPTTQPSAPKIETVTPGSGTVALTWSAPTSDGGSPILHYTATAAPGGAHCTVSALNCTLTGLVPTTSYVITLVAVNATGTGAPSATSAVYPFGPASLALELVKPEVIVGQNFVVIAAGGVAGASVSFTMPNATVAKCTLDSYGQCATILKQTKVGVYHVVGKSGTSSFSVTLYVPSVAAPNTVFHGRATAVKFSFCPPSAKIQFNIAGVKNYTVIASKAGAASLSIVIPKKGAYAITTLVNGVTVETGKKITAI